MQSPSAWEISGPETHEPGSTPGECWNDRQDFTVVGPVRRYREVSQFRFAATFLQGAIARLSALLDPRRGLGNGRKRTLRYVKNRKTTLAPCGQVFVE